MLTRTIFAFFVLCSFAVAQESEPLPPQPPVGPPRTSVVSPLRGMTPTMMLRMREQMTRELQQIQRQLGFINPQDAQLQKTLKDMQADLLAQVKDIDAQLKEQGVPLPTDVADAPDRPNVPAIPPVADPTLIPGGTPQQPTKAEDLLIQRPVTKDETAERMQVPAPVVPANPLPTGMMGGIVPGTPGMLPQPPSPMQPQTSIVPFAPMPAVPSMGSEPSKEFVELKQTVDSLRRELGEMRDTIKALETQIQLLNRNFLLMNPPPR